MQDNQLIADLRSIMFPPEKVEQLQGHGIETYSKLFTSLRDETFDPALRILACNAIFLLYRTIDRRRAVPPLLAALKSEDLEVRGEVVRALGQLRSRRAFVALMQLAQDKTEDELIRIYAVQALADLGDERAIPIIRDIMFDGTESLNIRTVAIEWSYSILGEAGLADYIDLLSNPISDLRFWAAFSLATLSCDISPALSALDKVAAFDHTLTELWGWHVNREAFEPLAHIYFQPYRQYYVDEYGEQNEHSWGMALISPAPEYERFLRLCRKQIEDGHYTVVSTPRVELDISVEWLTTELQTAWPQLSLNVIDSQAYRLNWLVEIGGFNLLGGLHRDGYAVVLTGNHHTIYTFTNWYRGIIPNHELYLYEWASPGIRLEAKMSVAQIKQAVEKQYEAFDAELRS